MTKNPTVPPPQWVFWLFWGFFNFMSHKYQQKLILSKNKVKNLSYTGYSLCNITYYIHIIVILIRKMTLELIYSYG